MARDIIIAFPKERRDVAPDAVLLALPSATLVVFADDDGNSTGPDAWACAGPVSVWARSAVVHAAGTDIGPYKEALEATRLVGHVVLVETPVRHQAAWLRLFAHVPTLSASMVNPPRAIP
jgi:hypothetical protein